VATAALVTEMLIVGLEGPGLADDVRARCVRDRVGLAGWEAFATILVRSWDTTEYGTGESPQWEGSALGSLVNQGLGPRLRPDPCAAVSGAGNVALGKLVTASAEATGAPASNAVDGLLANWWNSGGYPTSGS
jgi:hypothetical protein